MAEERVRYGDADLAEFKQLILKKLEQAKADYELLRSNITHSDDNDTQDTERKKLSLLACYYLHQHKPRKVALMH